MGQSTDAIIAYGFEIGEEDELPEFIGDAEDFDDYLDKLSGLPYYGEPGHSFADQRAFREQCPAELIGHCSGDYRMYILAVRGTQVLASRGSPVDVTNSFDTVEADKLDAFKKWCTERGIEGEPKWLLFSDWM